MGRVGSKNGNTRRKRKWEEMKEEKMGRKVGENGKRKQDGC